MHIPRFNSFGPDDFQLCLNCHNYDKIMGSLSNFRNETADKQLHYYHLSEIFKTIYSWDSDWDGVSGDWDGKVDSVVSCPACHNVHGSPSPAMARHGELISHPGTTEKVPALDFRWYLEDSVTETTVLAESRYGGMLCGVIGDLSYNRVCYGCHETSRILYNRLPVGVPTLSIDSVTVKDEFGNKKTSYAAGETVKYSVKFTISGPSDFYVKAEGWAYNKTGKDWASKFSKNKPLSTGTHKFRWTKTIPTEAKPGSKAYIKMIIRTYDQPKGILFNEEEKIKTFKIAN
jgi:hypothetical protein